MSRSLWKRFRQHQIGYFAFLLLGILGLAALLAPWIVASLGQNFYSQNIQARYAAPGVRIGIGSSERESRIEQYAEQKQGDVMRAIEFARSSEGTELFGELGLESFAVNEQDARTDAFFKIMDAAQDAQIQSAMLGASDASVRAAGALERSFSKLHLLGTDELGRDVFSRLLFGARVSIGVGLVVAFFSGVIGFSVGAIAGYFGGAIDSLLMRITDSLLSIPILPILIVMAAIDLAKLPWLRAVVSPDYESIAKLIFILCLFSWMTAARLVRGCVLSLREQEFVIAARSVGASSGRIIVRHILPNVIAPLLVAMTLNVQFAIIMEAALSFLGLGIQAPTPSWGNMLFNAQELIFEAPWLAFFPGLLIFITVVCFNFLGDGLQRAIDPKQA